MEEKQTVVTMGMVCRDREVSSTAGSLALDSYKGKRITGFMAHKDENFHQPKKQLPKEICAVPLYL